MKILNNSYFAMIASVIICILSVLISGKISLGKMRAGVDEIFVNGNNSDGYGIQYDLNAIADSSYNFLTVAKRYLPEADKAVTAVSEARATLIDASNPSDKYAASVKLTEALYELNSELALLENDGKLSESDKKYKHSIYADIQSSNNIISHSEYNNYASKFNQIISSFPAGVIAALFNINSAYIFG